MVVKNVTPYLSSVNRWAIHGFLRREDVPKERVTLFVANEGEEKEYRKALEAQSHGRKQNWCFFLVHSWHFLCQGSAWANVRIQISMPGVRDSRLSARFVVFSARLCAMHSAP